MPDRLNRRNFLKTTGMGVASLMFAGCSGLDKSRSSEEGLAQPVLAFRDVVTRLTKYVDQARADLDDPKNCRPVGKNMNPQYLVTLEKEDGRHNHKSSSFY